MSFETIRIYRDLQVIDGFVQLPPNREQDKTRVTADSLLGLADGSSRVRLSGRSQSPPPGTGVGQQELVRLPGLAPDEWYTTDPVTTYGG